MPVAQSSVGNQPKDRFYTLLKYLNLFNIINLLTHLNFNFYFRGPYMAKAFPKTKIKIRRVNKLTITNKFKYFKWLIVSCHTDPKTKNRPTIFLVLIFFWCSLFLCLLLFVCGLFLFDYFYFCFSFACTFYFWLVAFLCSSFIVSSCLPSSSLLSPLLSVLFLSFLFFLSSIMFFSLLFCSPLSCFFSLF